MTVTLSLIALSLVLFATDSLVAHFSGSPLANASAHSETNLPVHLAKQKHLVNPTSGALTPQDLWKMYNLPGLSGGAGQTIAEIIDGDLPTADADLQAYSKRFGLPQCTVASGCLTIKYQGGRKVPPASDPIEGLLDIEIMHATAPQAKILLYITSEKGNALAVGPGDILKTPGLRSINMSYGFNGTGKQFEHLYADNPNHVAMFAASGDSGNGVISPPSIYPEVIAVGGTVWNGKTETAWSGAGGGLSSLYAEPAYQKAYGIPQARGLRGNPDIAAVAGTPIVTREMGKWSSETGTSIASPIWTGIAALVNKPITNDMLYSLAKTHPDSFNDITVGTNGRCGFICTAHPGYDYITGLGTPKNFVANVNAMGK
ncbi:S53 family peptidase [Tengunoibacter tsumagoiensis]|uniref:Peptidase S53 domain-containing protein n=1 Tax=Tengunoibacter tsumagoiensis TaxID=2014871 RepID=A0A402AAG4_9CHLR|nr:S53 family peptidase [Tengunoibacter tsumagoiensis]GCE16172.1 hypothetical protein KTT_60310 [Tengunoibacter tsumagoiensis]